MTLGMVIQSLAVLVLLAAVFKLVKSETPLTRRGAGGVILLSIAMLASGAKLSSASVAAPEPAAPLVRLSPTGERLFAASIVVHGDVSPILPGIGRSVAAVREQLQSDRLPGADGVETVSLSISITHDHAIRSARGPLATLELDADALRGAGERGSDEDLVALANAVEISGDDNTRRLLRDECSKARAAVKSSALCRRAMTA